jgi:hypothetical protein
MRTPMMRTPIVRRTVLTCVLACGCAAIANAQGLEFGAKGGVSVATQMTTPAATGASYGYRAGLLAGGFVTVPLSSWIDVEADGLYASKGATLTILGLKSTAALDYFDVPVVARVKRGGAHRRYFAEGGASIAVRLRARAKTSFSGSIEDVDVSDQFERLDYGIVAGGGLEMSRLVIDGRYTYGLADVDKDKTDATTTKNSAFSVSVGVRF